MSEDLGNGMFEYLLVLDIPKGVFFDSAISLNKFVHAKYNFARKKKYYPHLTLILTCLHESKERQFIHFLNEVAESITPFEVEPTCCKGFDYNSVVYVDVKEEQPIVTIVNRLQKKLKGMLKPYKSLNPRFEKNPHITIEKGMGKVIYDRILAELQSENYIFDRFFIQQMILLKKPLGPYSREVVAVFKFLGKSGSQYIQGTLF